MGGFLPFLRYFSEFSFDLLEYHNPPLGFLIDIPDDVCNTDGVYRRIQHCEKAVGHGRFVRIMTARA